MSASENRRGGGLILLTLVVALVLSVIPLPFVAEPFRPNWVLMVLIYWSLALPHRVNVGVAWLAGLVLDVLLGSTLGLRAMAMAFVIYLIALQYQKLRNFSLLHQSLIVMLMVALQMWLVLWLEMLLANVPMPRDYFWPVITSAIFWPWLFLLLRKLRRDAKIN